MKKIILTCAFILITSNADAFNIRASSLFSNCQNKITYPACVYYVVGVLDGFEYQAKMLNVPSLFCEIIPSMAIQVKLPKVITDYAEKNPKVILGLASNLVYKAMKEFTCREWGIKKPEPKKLSPDDF